jgi:sigma-B regulation protein RsbU (phosphoserine phosphatase)
MQSLPVKHYTRVELKAGETLIVYTDGLFENANQDDEPFGQDNFKQLLLQHQKRDMNTLIDTMFSTVYDYCQLEPIEDDETLLVIRRISTAD